MYNFPTEVQILQETVGCTNRFTIFLEEQIANFLTFSSFWFTHFNESTNQNVQILCSTIIYGKGKVTVLATSLYRG